MDYTDDDVAYAEQVAASSSDPFDSSGVGSHGFRDPVFGRYDGADELEAELRSITGREQQEERGERSTAGWGEAQRFGHYEQDGEQSQHYSSPTPSLSRSPIASTSKLSRPFHPHYQQRPFPPAAPQIPAPALAPYRPIATRPPPKSNFIPLKPVPQAPPKPRYQPQKSSSSSFPVPANGNTNRRKDAHLRPAGGASIFQPGLGGSYAPSATFRAHATDMHDVGGRKGEAGPSGGQQGRPGRVQRSPDDEYFGGEGDDEFESALLDDEVLAEADQHAVAAPAPVLRRPQPLAPQAQYRQFDRDRDLPPTVRPNDDLRIKLRPVSDLPDMYRRMWRFGVFNAIQSTCFPSVYQSDENVVVSAPTGSGKTVLFELAILRLFSTSDSNDTKAVYMAPTKALTSERAADWKKKFEQLGLGWTVVELTGDTAPGPDVWKSIKKARLIITTPEKWDSITRSWHNHGKSFSQLALFCIDECHSVGMDVRGATLEVVVSRMKTLGTNTRFIAVSATVPNVMDVAEWLGSGVNDEKPAVVHEFDESYRPCKLQRIVVGYPPRDNDFMFNSTLNFKLYDLIRQFASGKPVLVFCNTRKACAQAAEILAKEYRQALESRRQDLPWPKPARLDFKLNDPKLGALVEAGVAYHHAGLEQQDRKSIESLFTNSSISVLCATSTLATGVNLPARMVIIKGTKAFRNSRFEEYGDMDVLQMIGRAGRPQYDTSGVALIMTENSLQSHYEALVNSENMLESCLHKNLAEHINSEITLRTITNVASALHWLRSTFLFVRIKKNPRFYAIANGTATSPDARLEEIVVDSVKALVANGIVDETDDFISPTTYGDMMSRNYLSQTTFVSIKNLPPKPTMRVLLETISAATEFQQTRFRQGEKGPLTKVNKDLKFPVNKPATSADKVMILIQLVLQCIPSSEFKAEIGNPHNEAGALWQQIMRMVRCIVDVLLERRDGAVKTAIELLRSVNAKAWDSSPFILRQIDGIGEKSVKALVDANITTFAAMAAAEPSRLEMLLGRNPPFGRKLIAMATAFPKFGITLTSEDEEIVETGVKVTVSVEISVEKTSPSCIVKKNESAYYAHALLTTSDGEYIDFRRLRLEQLVAQGSKTYAVAVILCRPSQRIVGSLSCDYVAGSEVRSKLKTTTLPSMFPVPAIGEHFDEEEGAEDNWAAEANGTAASVKHPSPVAVIVKKSIDPEPKPARQRPDGRWECNHQCRDKTACKHLCCREGLDNPPQARRVTAKTTKDSGVSSTKPDPLTQSKAKAFSSLFHTPALKSERLPAKSTSTISHTLKAFGGKTVAQLLEEGSDGEDAGATTETKLKSDEDLLTLDQLLKENKKQKAARDDRAFGASAILKPSQAPIVSGKRKAPGSPIDLSDDELPAVAHLKFRPKPNILDFLRSDDEDEIDELAGDEALGDPITAVQPPAPTKRMPAPRKTRRVAEVSGSSTTLVIADSSDSEVDEVDEAPNSAEDPEAEVMDMEVDREASEEAHERVEPSFEDAEEDDFEEWLQSSVTVRAV